MKPLIELSKILRISDGSGGAVFLVVEENSSLTLDIIESHIGKTPERIFCSVSVSQLSDHENYYNFFDNRPSNSITLVEGFEKLSDEQLKGLVRRMNGHSFLSKQCLTILLVSPNIQGYFLHHAPDLSNRTITIDTTQQDLDLGQQP